MGIRSQVVTATSWTIEGDDGRSFRLTRPAMKAVIDAKAADSKVTDKRAAREADVLAQIAAALGPENFSPKAFLLDVNAAGSFLGVGISTDSKETFA